jgi:hypothetical protein
MSNLDATVLLVDHLEATLRRLETGNGEFLEACCACLQDVGSMGHLPSCYLAQALEEVGAWRTRNSK